MELRWSSISVESNRALSIGIWTRHMSPFHGYEVRGLRSLLLMQPLSLILPKGCQLCNNQAAFILPLTVFVEQSVSTAQQYARYRDQRVSWHHLLLQAPNARRPRFSSTMHLWLSPALFLPRLLIHDSTTGCQHLHGRRYNALNLPSMSAMNLTRAYRCAKRFPRKTALGLPEPGGPSTGLTWKVSRRPSGNLNHKRICLWPVPSLIRTNNSGRSIDRFRSSGPFSTVPSAARIFRVAYS